jgi:hypothetical protein
LNVYFMNIGTVFDIYQIAGQDLGLNVLTLLLISSHPSGQKGFCGHSIIPFRVPAFLSAAESWPAARAAARGGADGELIRINIFGSGPRYGVSMAQLRGH